MKILMSFDSFKGTLSSIEAGQIAARAAAQKGYEAEIISASDGGEGLTESFILARGGKTVMIDSFDPLMNKIKAPITISGDTSVIECASTAGLCLVPPEKRNPALTTTFGLGISIKAALEMGARKIIIGLGGSATNDGGAGMAAALGVVFKKSDETAFIPTGGTLGDIAEIDTSKIHPMVKKTQFIACCDVTNPLCGSNGASRIYAPQKGASPDEVNELEKNMASYSLLIGEEISSYAGSGAAGGLGAAVKYYLSGKLAPGFETVAELIGIENKIAAADIVFTGEGCTDSQTENGKLPAGVAGLCLAHNKPCYIISGAVRGDPKIGGATRVIATTTESGMPSKSTAEQRLYDTVSALLDSITA